MNMVRHNNIFIYSYAWNSIAGQNIFFGNQTDFCQAGARGVEGAAPYDMT